MILIVLTILSGLGCKFNNLLSLWIFITHFGCSFSSGWKIEILHIWVTVWGLLVDKYYNGLTAAAVLSIVEQRTIVCTTLCHISQARPRRRSFVRRLSVTVSCGSLRILLAIVKQDSRKPPKSILLARFALATMRCCKLTALAQKQQPNGL